MADNQQPETIEFFFDIMCPYAYQTSVWIREAQAQVGFNIRWRFFSLEEVNREEGKPHPWEREFAYGWTPMRVAAWLRRQDNEWCGKFYEVCGRTLHVDGRRHYDKDIALELLAEAGLPLEAWDEAPSGDRARELWDLTVGYARFPGLFELKTPKTDDDMQMIGRIFSPYLEARQWRTIQNPAR